MRKLTITLALATGLFVASVPSASAEEFTCRRTVRSITVDNLRVPDGASCTLKGTTVKGSITVGSGAMLRAEGVRVIGNVQAEGATRVTIISSSRLGGSVQVVQGGAAKVANSRVSGDILYDENMRSLTVLRNTVGGSVQVFANTGGVEIRGNRIDGNLQCKENTPKPAGGNNVVDGNKEDQCARL